MARGAQRQRIEAEARVLFDKAVPDVMPIDDPLSAYAAFAGKVMTWFGLMDSLLDGLDAPRYAGRSSEQIRGEVVLFERAMDRANTVLSAYAKLNIDDRLMKIEEAKAELVIKAVGAALDHAGIYGEAALAAKRVAARHLRVIAAAPVQEGA